MAGTRVEGLGQAGEYIYFAFILFLGICAAIVISSVLWQCCSWLRSDGGDAEPLDAAPRSRTHDAGAGVGLGAGSGTRGPPTRITKQQWMASRRDPGYAGGGHDDELPGPKRFPAPRGSVLARFRSQHSAESETELTT